MADAQAKTVRIIALDVNAQKAGHIKVVNIVTIAGSSNSVKGHAQASGAATANAYPTYMASGAPNSITSGLPTIHISGYSGPI